MNRNIWNTDFRDEEPEKLNLVGRKPIIVKQDKKLVCPNCGHILATLCTPYGLSLPDGTTISCHKCVGSDIAIFKDGWFEWMPEWPKFEQECDKTEVVNEKVL